MTNWCSPYSQNTMVLIFGQKSCFLGPTIFKIPQPNWYYSSYSNLVINYLITTVSSSFSNFLKSWDAWKFVNSLVQQCWRWCKAVQSLSVSGKDFTFLAKVISACLTGTLEPKSLALSALSTPGEKKSLKDLTFVLFFVFWREKSKQ